LANNTAAEKAIRIDQKRLRRRYMHVATLTLPRAFLRLAPLVILTFFGGLQVACDRCVPRNSWQGKILKLITQGEFYLIGNNSRPNAAERNSGAGKSSGRSGRWRGNQLLLECQV